MAKIFIATLIIIGIGCSIDVDSKPKLSDIPKEILDACMTYLPLPEVLALRTLSKAFRYKVSPYFFCTFPPSRLYSETDSRVLSRMVTLIDPNDNRFSDALKRFCINNNEPAIRMLLQSGKFDPSTRANEALKIACSNGYTECFKTLVEDPRVNVTANSNALIREAAASGSLEIVRLLLQNPNVNPGDLDSKAFRDACDKGHFEIVKLLLKDPRVQPAVFESLGFRLAANNGHSHVIRILLDDGRSDICARENEAFRNALSSGHTKVVSLFLLHKNAHLIAPKRLRSCPPFSTLKKMRSFTIADTRLDSESQ